MALLVIDVQGEYFDPDGPAYVEHAHDIVGNVNRLIDALSRRRASPSSSSSTHTEWTEATPGAWATLGAR